MGLNKISDQVSAEMPGLLDFSNSAPTADPIYVSDFIHEAFIKVNETGTEAAAFTGKFIDILILFYHIFEIVARIKGGGDYVDFHVDHPFFYFIRSATLKSIPIFCGSIYKPVTNEPQPTL